MRIRIVHAAQDGALAATLSGRLAASGLLASWNKGEARNPCWAAEQRSLQEADVLLLVATAQFAASPALLTQAALGVHLGKRLLALEAGGEAFAPLVARRLAADLSNLGELLGIKAAATGMSEVEQRLRWRLRYFTLRLGYLGEAQPMFEPPSGPLTADALQRLHWRARYLAARTALLEKERPAALRPTPTPNPAFAGAEQYSQSLGANAGMPPEHRPAKHFRAAGSPAAPGDTVYAMEVALDEGIVSVRSDQPAPSPQIAAGEPSGTPPGSLKKTSTAQRPATSPKLERASVSAFAPKFARPGARLLVQAFVHTPMQAAEVREMAAERDDAAVRKGISAVNQRLAHHDRLRLVLEADGLKLKRAEHLRVWLGQPVEAAFEIQIPLFKSARDYLLRLRLEVNGAPAGELAFTLKVSSKAAKAPAPEPQDAYQPHRYVFCSYASEDRTSVLVRTQMLERLGVPFFQDIASLRAGEEWRPALERHMGQADLVMLFWSKAAARSDWVRKEIEWALDLQNRSPEALPRILPVLLDGPPPAKPPKSLAHLHFSDPLRTLAKAWE